MEKLLLAQDAQCLKINTIDFGCYVARLTRSRLTGVFLEDVQSERPAPADQGTSRTGATGVHVQQADATDITEENIRLFREACLCRGVTSRIHRDRGIPAPEIIEESRFADLIVMDPEITFTTKNESLPGHFVHDILSKAECPVMMAPYDFESIEQIYFAYNSTPSSMFAIKQFTYLFPDLIKKKITVLNVRSIVDEGVEDAFKMKEWMKEHYAEVEYVLLKGDPADQLFAYLLERKNGIVVMGAYGRGVLSRFFKPSHARLIIKTVNMPIFIAHH
jgi:nucleotide-binding universal stress UspA family protein